MQNFYFKVIENSLEKYKEEETKSIEDKKIVNLFQQSHQIKKKIFKRILYNLNFPNRKIELELIPLGKLIDKYQKINQEKSKFRYLKWMKI